MGAQMSRPTNERLAVVEQKVSHMEEQLDKMFAYGQWTRPRMQNFREQCCDCGLIHRLDFRVVDGRVEFRTRRDDRATAAARRTFNFSSDE
jgi:hypothetical protein